MSSKKLALLIVAASFVVRSSAVLRANGEEFFAPFQGAKPRLAYFGQLKDAVTGKVIPTLAIMVISDKKSGMTFPFPNDRPGHYRSPDIGEIIKGVGGNVQPSDLEMLVSIEGYRNVTVTKFPRRESGAVEISLRLEPDSAGATPSASQGPAEVVPETAGEGGASAWGWLFVGLTATVLTVGGVARTAGRRGSKGRSFPAAG